MGDAMIIYRTMFKGSAPRFIASAVPMGAVIILSVLFCKKKVSITIFILSLITLPALFINSKLFTVAEMGSLLTGFGMLITVSTLLSYLIISINVKAKRRRTRESEDQRNEQIEIIKSLIDSLNSIS